MKTNVNTKHSFARITTRNQYEISHMTRGHMTCDKSKWIEMAMTHTTLNIKTSTVNLFIP